MRKNNKRGGRTRIWSPKITHVNILYILFSAVLIVGSLMITTEITENFEQFEACTEEYSVCIDSINTIRNTTDVMTNMVEKFYNNIDETYVYNYFEAFDDGKTYQDALSNIAKYHNND